MDLILDTVLRTSCKPHFASLLRLRHDLLHMGYEIEEWRFSPGGMQVLLRQLRRTSAWSPPLNVVSHSYLFGIPLYVDAALTRAREGQAILRRESHIAKQGMTRAVAWSA